MKNIKGFSLVEVLVAVVILSTALLGLVGLQVRGVKNVVTSYNRTQASQLASSMADRMRANAVNASLGSASTYLTTPLPLPRPSASPASICMTSTGCTAAQMALNDLYEWNTALKDTSNGLTKTGTITSVDNCPTSPTIRFTITVSWSENLDDNKDGIPDPVNFETIFQLPRASCP